MFLYIIAWTIIYFILILLLHNLYLFFQRNLTTTKTKDYYYFPNNEYNKINNILNSQYNLCDNKFKINDITHNEISNEITNEINNKINNKINNNNNNNINNIFPNNNINNNNINNIFPNNDINLTSINIETKSDQNYRFNLEKLNSQFENNNMKGVLEELLSKLNN